MRIAKSPKKAKILRRLSILDKLQILKARFGYFLKIKGGLETKGSRKKDINTHYSLDEWFDNDEDSNKFYMYWLKSSYVQYTCARWDPEIKTLDQAQKNKFEYYAKRMGITKASKGKTIADLGCGWGGVSFYFAEKFGVHCTCITLSTAQAKYIKAEVKKRKLSKLITVVLDDAHNLAGSFDHIISVGMLEHIREFDALYKTVSKALKPNGTALFHAIFTKSSMHAGDGFLGKYIFPGAWFPTIHTTEQSMNRHFGFVERKELPKGSYPKTLQCWYKDFCKNETKIKALIDKSGKCKDPEFAARIFKHYLVFAESVMVEEHRMCNFLLKKPKK